MKERQLESSVSQSVIDWAAAFVDLLDGYFNIEYFGLENIPVGERYVFTHNHCGWPSLDSLVIGKKVVDMHTDMGIEEYPLLSFWHDLVVRSPIVGDIIRGLGGVSVRDLNSYESWDDYRVFVTPAEGEEGSFRSSFHGRGKLAPFRSGIGRIACLAKADYIMPVSILGPEESFPALGRLKIPLKAMLDLIEGKPGMDSVHKAIKSFSNRDILIPLVLPLLQCLPFSWYVRYHPPIDIRDLVNKSQDGVYDRELYLQIASLARECIMADLLMQSKIRSRFRVKRPRLSSSVKKRLIDGVYRGVDRLEEVLVDKLDKKIWAYGNDLSGSEEEEVDNVIPFPTQTQEASGL